MIQIALHQRTPRLQDDLVLACKPQQFLLGERRMQFDLVHNRYNPRILDDMPQVADLEVADADGTNKSFFCK